MHADFIASHLSTLVFCRHYARFLPKYSQRAKLLWKTSIGRRLAMKSECTIRVTLTVVGVEGRHGRRTTFLAIKRDTLRCVSSSWLIFQNNYMKIFLTNPRKNDGHVTFNYSTLTVKQADSFKLDTSATRPSEFAEKERTFLTKLTKTKGLTNWTKFDQLLAYPPSSATLQDDVEW